MQIRVAIAVSDEALERLEEVAYTCHTLGFRASSTLTHIGVMTGFIEVDRVTALRAVPGVEAVELERA